MYAMISQNIHGIPHHEAVGLQGKVPPHEPGIRLLHMVEPLQGAWSETTVV